MSPPRTLKNVFEENADRPHGDARVMSFEKMKITLMNATLIGDGQAQIKISRLTEIWGTISKIAGSHITCAAYENELNPKIGQVNILNQTLRFLIG